MSRSSSLRRPSPPASPGREEALRAKVDEIKRLRGAGVLGGAKAATEEVVEVVEVEVPSFRPPPSPPPKRKRVIINGKPADKWLGEWAKMASSR